MGDDCTRDEILEAFRGFDACSGRHDWKAAAEYFTDDARAGNVRLGIPDRMRSNRPDRAENRAR